jgi:hypothetical protein
MFVDTYYLLSVLWTAVQELSEQVKQMKSE